ncbi:hypothetical protein [Novosphingobium resinovorum]|uniref:hypothetical protein n=1 Tax=Novosphingobium resinovorum TaxID=158500 RepID=UPI0012EA0A84|nr:hypothetical protein [Novosphingobium resinovorum]
MTRFSRPVTPVRRDAAINTDQSNLAGGPLFFRFLCALWSQASRRTSQAINFTGKERDLTDMTMRLELRHWAMRPAAQRRDCVSGAA